jgi:hypothetical protein
VARKKIEDISTVKLLKQRKFFILIKGIYIGIFLAYLAIMIYGFVRNGKLDRSSLTSGILILATFWIPIWALKEIKAELERR